jgi:zinc protease
MKDMSIKVLRPLSLLTVVLSALAAYAQSPASQVAEFDVNGMKVLIKKRPGTPTVAAGLYIRGGVRNLTPETAGLENFTLDAATEGSKLFPKEKLRRETSRMGTSIGSSSGYDYSAISLVSTKKSFDQSWQIFTDVILNPAFAPDSVEHVRQNILTGLRSQEDTPEGALEAVNEKLVFAGHPYAIDPDGTVETVTKFKTSDLAEYYRKLMQTSRLLLVVVGDVEPDALQKRIAAAFGNLPKGDRKEAAASQVVFAKPSVDISTKSLQTDYVKGTFAAPAIGSTDYYAMRAAIAILQARLFQEIRVKRNLSYAPDADLDERAANTGNVSVSSVNPNESVKIMLAEIQDLKQNPVNEETIAQMAGFFLTSYYLKQETNAAQVSQLAQYELIGGGWRNAFDFLDAIRKVTPGDVQTVAQKYMKNLRFVAVGNPADIDKSVFLAQN